jgi:hypothetical protein
VAFLLGPASQPFVEYEAGLLGRARAFLDALLYAGNGYPVIVTSLAVVGVALHVTQTRGKPLRRLAGLVPLVAAGSFVVAFNCAARRTDARFVMPPALLVAAYAGVAMAWLWSRCSSRRTRLLARAAVVGAGAWGACGVANADVNLLLDPRYDAERWLQEHVAPADVVETYGLNTYLPRFGGRMRVERVDPRPGAHAHPLPGVTEITGDYERVDARRPRWIVVSEAWARRFEPEASRGWGRITPADRLADEDTASAAYFRALAEDRQPDYELAYRAHWTHVLFPPLDLHGSTAPEIRVYRRHGLP